MACLIIVGYVSIFYGIRYSNCDSVNVDSVLVDSFDSIVADSVIVDSPVAK